MSDLVKLIEEFKHRLIYTGFKRGKCTENSIDDNDYGVIRIFIPDIMTNIDPNSSTVEDHGGILARPGNNPIGGRNDKDKDGDSFFQGTVYVPAVGSWVWVFFEGADPNKPFYFASLDISNTKLPPENRINYDGNIMESPHKAYTILKTHSGRTICVSDSEDCQRIEITGKKSTLSGNDPAGNDESTYTIDNNMTTILFDERDGKEKILIRSHNGDFIHFDIDEQQLQLQFESDILVKNNGDTHWQTEGDMHIKANGSIYFEATNSIHTKSGNVTNIESGTDTNIKVGGKFNTKSEKDTSIKSGKNVNSEASSNINMLAATKLSGKAGSNLNMKAGANLNNEAESNLNMKAGANLNNEAGVILNNKAGAALNSEAGAVHNIGAGANVIIFGVSGTSLQGAPASPASPASSADTANGSDNAESSTSPSPIDPIGERET